MTGTASAEPRERSSAATTGVQPLTPELEREWDELARRCDASPFRRPAYIALWRATFDPRGAAPDLVIARRAGRLAGALPVIREGGRVRPLGNFETPAGGIVADDAAAATAVARAVLGADARRVDLERLPADGETRRAIERAAAAAGHRVIRRTTMRSPVVDTHEGWQAYWSSRSRNLRHNVERCGRRGRELGELTADLRRDVAEADLDRLLDEGFAVEGSGWKTAQGTAILTDPRARRYYTELARWAGREGWLRLSFIRIDGRAIAFSLGVESFGTHHALKMGYDVAWARVSPGMLLLEALIRRSFDEGLARFDFAGHDEQYKLAWATGTDDQVSLSVFRATPAGQVAHRLEQARIALAESPLGPVLRPMAVGMRCAASRMRGRRDTHVASAESRETT